MWQYSTIHVVCDNKLDHFMFPKTINDVHSIYYSVILIITKNVNMMMVLFVSGGNEKFKVN